MHESIEPLAQAQNEIAWVNDLSKVVRAVYEGHSTEYDVIKFIINNWNSPGYSSAIKEQTPIEFELSSWVGLEHNIREVSPFSSGSHWTKLTDYNTDFEDDEVACRVAQLVDKHFRENPLSPPNLDKQGYIEKTLAFAETLTEHGRSFIWRIEKIMTDLENLVGSESTKILAIPAIDNLSSPSKELGGTECLEKMENLAQVQILNLRKSLLNQAWVMARQLKHNC